MKAEIISIGTEILLGDIMDTNAHYIASRLPALGIDLYFISAVGDNPGRLTDVLKQAWGRSDIVLCTGGLGPTEDDVTREAIARLLGEEPYIDEALAGWIRRLFQSRGLTMPERNIKQAMLIPSAQSVPNPLGTAPGWWVEKGGRVLVAMPGPPGELRHMWEAEVAPRLARLATGAVILSRTLKTAGIGEARVDEMVGPLLKSANPTIGVYSRADGIHLRLTAKAPSREEAQELIADMEGELRRILGPAVWGADDDTLEGAVGAMLAERGLTLAIMESCTGGLLASTITDVPGSSRYFRGGLVSYSTEAKIDWGVERELVERHGVISAQVARAMAAAARRLLEVDIGLGITGVAGPDPQEGKLPGTVHIAVDDGHDPQAFSVSLPGDRELIKRRAVTTALMLLRRALVG